MKATKVQKLLEKIIELNKEQENWINKLPNEISSVFFDNTYSNSKSKQIDVLIDFIFENWGEDVSCFIYDPKQHMEVTTQKATYIINGIDEYIDYMVAEGFLTEDRNPTKTIT